MNESLGYLTYALVGVDLVLCLIVFLFTKQSLNAFTVTISYLQVIILMGMLNAEMPENFLGFITEISEMMLPFGFLSRGSISGAYPGWKQFERELEICLLTQIMGLDDRSSWSALFYHTLLLVLLLLFHALLLCLYHRDQNLKKLVSISALNFRKEKENMSMQLKRFSNIVHSRCISPTSSYSSL